MRPPRTRPSVSGKDKRRPMAAACCGRTAGARALALRISALPKRYCTMTRALEASSAVCAGAGRRTGPRSVGNAAALYAVIALKPARASANSALRNKGVGISQLRGRGQCRDASGVMSSTGKAIASRCTQAHKTPMPPTCRAAWHPAGLQNA